MAATEKRDGDVAATMSGESTGETLMSLGGIRFGEPVAGAARVVDRVCVVSGESVAASGLADVVVGPQVRKTFPGFSNRPHLAVMVKSRRVWRMIFAGAETVTATNSAKVFQVTADALAARLKRPVEKVAGVADRIRFRRGETTVDLGIRENRLELEVTHAGFQREAVAETATRRAELLADIRAPELDATGYPLGESVKYTGLEFAPNTPKAFCGLVFGCRPGAGAHFDRPVKGVRGFFVDYAGLAVRPFRGFSFGRADLDRRRGGVSAVRVYSAGAPDELTEVEYFDNLRRTLAARYGEPVEKACEVREGFPALTFTAGDVAITLAPDPRGGFALEAVHRVYASLLPR